MSESENPLVVRAALVLVGFLVAVGAGVAIGYTIFSDSSDVSGAEGDRELACVSLEQLPDGSFEELMDEGVAPNYFRLVATGSHAMAGADEGAPWYEAGKGMQDAAARQDTELGNAALEDLRDLCADR